MCLFVNKYEKIKSLPQHQIIFDFCFLIYLFVGTIFFLFANSKKKPRFCPSCSFFAYFAYSSAKILLLNKNHEKIKTFSYFLEVFFFNLFKRAKESKWGDGFLVGKCGLFISRCIFYIENNFLSLEKTQNHFIVNFILDAHWNWRTLFIVYKVWFVNESN